MDRGRRFLLTFASIAAITMLITGLPDSSAAIAGYNQLSYERLEPGQSHVLSYRLTRPGPLTLEIDFYAQELALGYILYHDPENESAPIEIAGGVIDEQRWTESWSAVPAGSLYLHLYQVPPEGSNKTSQAQALEYNLRIGPGLELNREHPPYLYVFTPTAHQGFWEGEDLELMLSTDPFFPVFLTGYNEPLLADEDGMLRVMVTPTDAPLQIIQAMVVGPTGHLTLTDIPIRRRFILETPQQEPLLSRQPVLGVRVRNVKDVDLEASSFSLGGQMMRLRTDEMEHLIFGRPERSLPGGKLLAELKLVGKAEAFGGEPVILDELSWLVEIIDKRYAELWPGDKRAVVNGATVHLEAAPYIERTVSSTMLPFRFIGDVLGAVVEWNAASRQVSFSLEETEILLTIGDQTAMVNGLPVRMPLAPLIVNGRTMVPLRFVAENLGADVQWDAVLRKVIIRAG